LKRFRCLHDRVLVLPDAAPVKLGGLAQAPSQAPEPERGKVVAAGPLAQCKYSMDGGGVPGGMAIGQEVQWARFAGRDLLVNGVSHKLLRLEEIDGVWEDE
jgi:co-chaperonin GroES (HSP10)